MKIGVIDKRTIKKVTPEQTRERLRKWLLIYQKLNPKKRLLWSARRRAKNKGIECSIKEEDIVIPEFCPYLGIKLDSKSKRGSPRTNVYSLDRIDNSKGYIKGNIEVISHLANTMKSNATKEQLVLFAAELLKRLI